MVFSSEAEFTVVSTASEELQSSKEETDLADINPETTGTAETGTAGTTGTTGTAGDGLGTVFKTKTIGVEIELFNIDWQEVMAGAWESTSIGVETTDTGTVIELFNIDWQDLPSVRVTETTWLTGATGVTVVAGECLKHSVKALGNDDIFEINFLNIVNTQILVFTYNNV